MCYILSIERQLLRHSQLQKKQVKGKKMDREKVAEVLLDLMEEGLSLIHI